MEAGEAQGITAGCLLDVYAPGTKDFANRPALTRVEVTAVEPFASTAKLLKPAAVPALSRAVLRQCGYPQQRLGVHFLNPKSNSQFAAIRSAIESKSEPTDRTHRRHRIFPCTPEAPEKTGKSATRAVCSVTPPCRDAAARVLRAHPLGAMRKGM